jgi:hypothetical protein
MRALRHARRDRPEPRRVSAGLVCPHDAANVLVAVEYVVIIVRPLAVRATFRCVLKGEHGQISGSNNFPGTKGAMRVCTG